MLGLAALNTTTELDRLQHRELGFHQWGMIRTSNAMATILRGGQGICSQIQLEPFWHQLLALLYMGVGACNPPLGQFGHAHLLRAL